MKKTTDEYKVCPLLEALGISPGDGYAGEGICQVCGLPRCIYDKPGAVSKKDREILMREAKKWEKREQ